LIVGMHRVFSQIKGKKALRRSHKDLNTTDGWIWIKFLCMKIAQRNPLKTV
jgi:hypothetical protein